MVGQLVISDADDSEIGDTVERIVAGAGGLIPNRYGNVDGFEHIQSGAHIGGIRYPRAPLHPIANRYHGIGRLVGVAIRLTIARGRQTEDKGRDIRRTGPS